MKKISVLQGTVAAFFMLLLILDTKTAIDGAQEGITMCIRTVIPALFPFILLSGILGSSILGTRLGMFKPLCRLTGIPQGAESILFLGLISGYPVGAQLVSAAYDDGNLSQTDARRMLAFCSNAGPAFIFGIFSIIFDNKLVPWVLWITHILGALLVAAILPNKSSAQCVIAKKRPISVTESLERTIRIMGSICGWIIIFRIIIAYLNRRLIGMLPMEFKVLASGFLELTNGCVRLAGIRSDGMKFLLAGGMLSFGGLCVLMQTISVTRSLGCGQYFLGKVMQTAFTFVMNAIAQHLLFSKSEIVSVLLLATILCLAVPISILVHFKRKKVVAFA